MVNVIKANSSLAIGEERTEANPELIPALVDHVVDVFHHRLLAFIERAENEDTLFALMNGDLAGFMESLRMADSSQDHLLFTVRFPHERSRLPYEPKGNYPGIEDQYDSIVNGLKARMVRIKEMLCSTLKEIAEPHTLIGLVNQIHEAFEILMEEHFVDGDKPFKNIPTCLEAMTLRAHGERLGVGSVIAILSKDLVSATPEERSMIGSYVANHWMRPNDYTYDRITKELGDISQTTVFRSLRNGFPLVNEKARRLWDWLRAQIVG